MLQLPRTDGKSKYKGVYPPSVHTLDKYGLSLPEWERLIDETKGKCPICDRPIAELKMVIDHAHVPGWAKMEPQLRKLFVRGVVCMADNHWVLSHFITEKKHTAAAKYLAKFRKRHESPTDTQVDPKSA